MNEDYGRDLDLNLLRVFVVVAETRSVTAAAARLYLTQPAISAALRRLNGSIGTPLFARQGRGLVLTTRGERLLAIVKPQLRAMVDAVLRSPSFDPKTSDRVLTLGLADAAEGWLLPPLLRILEREAPHMRVVVVPAQFRSVASMLTSRAVDVAVTVADELPAGILRAPLFFGGFVCLFDPRHVHVEGDAFTEDAYFACEHVIVSYNGDLRGLIEDVFHRARNVRCSVPSFGNIGAIVDGSSLVATLPKIVANQIVSTRPHLRIVEKPFVLAGAPIELLWSAALEDDDACRFLRDLVKRVGAPAGARPLGQENVPVIKTKAPRAERTSPRARVEPAGKPTPSTPTPRTKVVRKRAGGAGTPRTPGPERRRKKP